jgi:hypothetical protein
MENEEDQVQDDTLKEEQDIEEQSEETAEEPAVEQEQEQVDPTQLTKALQKGYTQQAQQLADLRRELATLKEQEAAQAPVAEEEITPQSYEEMKKDLTSSLKNELVEELTKPQKEQEENQRVVEEDLDTLYTMGKITSEEEESKFLKFGNDVAKDLGYAPRPLQLFPLYEKFLVAQKGGEVTKAKQDVQREAGSQIGKTSKTTGEEKNVPSYSEIHNTDMMNL